MVKTELVRPWVRFTHEYRQGYGKNKTRISIMYTIQAARRAVTPRAVCYGDPVAAETVRAGRNCDRKQSKTHPRSHARNSSNQSMRCIVVSESTITSVIKATISTRIADLVMHGREQEPCGAAASSGIPMCVSPALLPAEPGSRAPAAEPRASEPVIEASGISRTDLGCRIRAEVEKPGFWCGSRSELDVLGLRSRWDAPGR